MKANAFSSIKFSLVYEAARDAGLSHRASNSLSIAKVYTRMVQIIKECRSFIKTADYEGTDRRCEDSNVIYIFDDRRKSQDDIQENPDISLSQKEIDVLMGRVA